MKDKNLINVSNAEEKDIRKIAELVINTFKKQERITRFVTKPSKEKNQEKIIELAELKAKNYIKSSQNVLVAKKQNEILGCAILKNSNKTDFLKSLNVYFPRVLFLIIPAIKNFNLRNLLAVSKVIRLKQKIKKPYYYLEAIVVNKKYQGNGVGKILLSKIEEILYNSKDYKGVYLFTGDLKNKLIYEKLGYEVIEKNTNKKITVYHMFKKNKKLKF